VTGTGARSAGRQSVVRAAEALQFAFELMRRRDSFLLDEPLAGHQSRLIARMSKASARQPELGITFL